jgi:hypothetical protein
MHEEVKRFEIEGIVGDEADVVINKNNLARFVEQDMRDEGYAPDLEKEIQYNQSYDEQTNQFEFKLSVYGVYVGEEAWRVAGVMGGKTILKSTLPAKSKES